MLRSMYSGISGLKNFQNKLDVIGNNISNVNTFGFKKSRVTFKDMISQNVAGASAPGETRGGINPKQVGLGSQIAAIDVIQTGGNLQSTGRMLDLAISGDGFFVLGDASGSNFSYTRAGNFYLDSEGYLVNGEGKYLIGSLQQNAEDLSKNNSPAQNGDGAIANVSRIRIPTDAVDLSIGSDGSISYISSNGKILTAEANLIYEELEGAKQELDNLIAAAKGVNATLAEVQANLSIAQVVKSQAETAVEIAKNAIEIERNAIKLAEQVIEEQNNIIKENNATLLAANVTSANNILTTVNSRFQTAESTVNTAHTTLQSTTTNLETEKTKLDTAENALEASRVALETAIKAQALNPSLTIIQQQTAHNAAKTAYDTQKLAYDNAKTAFDTTKAAYDDAIIKRDELVKEKNAADVAHKLAVQKQAEGPNRIAEANLMILEATDSREAAEKAEAVELDKYLQAEQAIASSILNIEELETRLKTAELAAQGPNKKIEAARMVLADLEGRAEQFSLTGRLLSAGQLVLAKFANPSGLQKSGSNAFTPTANSGEIVYNYATESGIGKIESSMLEMSNVDLSEEFTEMIVAQRAFQANTRIITTSDEVLQELVNLKR